MLFKNKENENILKQIFWTFLSSSVDFLLFLLYISKLEKNQTPMK